jgi:hypothetical protein
MRAIYDFYFYRRRFMQKKEKQQREQKQVQKDAAPYMHMQTHTALTGLPHSHKQAQKGERLKRATPRHVMKQAAL